MKRLTLYNIFNCIILILFAVLVALEVNYRTFGITPKQFWFPCFLICVGLSLLLKSMIYRSDSALWFAITFLSNGAVIYVIMYSHLTFFMMWPTMLTSVPAFSSLLLTIFFKDFLHLKIFTFLSIVGVALYLLSFSVVNIWWFIPIFIFSFIFAFFICALLPERFHYKKKER